MHGKFAHVFALHAICFKSSNWVILVAGNVVNCCCLSHDYCTFSNLLYEQLYILSLTCL